MNKYEMLYILNPELSEEAREAVIAKLEDIIAKDGGIVVSTEKWGMKKLQYPIQFKNEGFYVLTVFESSPEFVQELKRVIGISEGIMRRLITKA